MNKFPIKIEHFILLKAIVTFKSFKKAANYLGISQTSITLQIKKLEKELEIPIFYRTPTLSLTTAGYVLHKYGEKIIFLYEEVYKTLKDLDLNKDTLNIGASQTIGTYLMPQLLGVFKKNYPFITLKLEIHSTRRLAWYVANGQLDFAIVGGILPKELKSTLDVVPYANDELVLILSPSHPLANMTELRKEELYKLNFVTLNSSSSIQQSINSTLQQNGIDTQQLFIQMELNTIEGIKNAVESGLGAAFVSSSSIKKELKLKTLSKIKIKNLFINRTLFIIAHPNKYKKKIHKTFELELLNIIKTLSTEND